MAKFEIWSKEYENAQNQIDDNIPNIDEDNPAVDIPSDNQIEDTNEPEIIDPTSEDQLPNNFGEGE